MAQFNEILQGRFNQLLTRLFAMKGGSPSPQLAAEIQPVFSVGELQGDLHYLADERMGARSHTVTGDATHPGRIALMNFTPGIIVTVEHIIISNDNATTEKFSIRSASPGLANNAVGYFRDSRVRGNTGAFCGSSATTAAAGNPVISVQLPASSSLVIPVEFVLVANSAIEVATVANQKICTVSFTWVERPVGHSETV